MADQRYAAHLAGRTTLDLCSEYKSLTQHPSLIDPAKLRAMEDECRRRDAAADAERGRAGSTDRPKPGDDKTVNDPAPDTLASAVYLLAVAVRDAGLMVAAAMVASDAIDGLPKTAAAFLTRRFAEDAEGPPAG